MKDFLIEICCLIMIVLIMYLSFYLLIGDIK